MSLACLSMLYPFERTCPVVIIVGELSLTLNSCNTWENRPYTSPGKYNRANPDSAGVGELAMKL